MVPHCLCKLVGKYSVQEQCENMLMDKTAFGEHGVFFLWANLESFLEGQKDWKAL